MSDRVLVMRQGRIAGAELAPGAAATQEAVMAAGKQGVAAAAAAAA